jgi:hypothetical protein
VAAIKQTTAAFPEMTDEKIETSGTWLFAWASTFASTALIARTGASHKYG